MSRILSSVALALTLGLAAAPAGAQGMGPQGMGMMGGGCPMMDMMGRGMMGPGMMMGQGGGGPGMGRGMMGGRHPMAAMVDGRLAYLKAQLGITAEQATAWSAYSEAAKSRVDVMQEMHRAMMNTMQAGTAPGRMDARIKGMEAMVEAMKAAKPALDKLYAALTDEQKAIADDLIGMDCGAM